ncbi:hypothetical protein CCP3SC1AL1_400013 [Gammaproteobacteria bacterium]
MPQITKGDTFTDGQQVTAARLNQLVDSATILPSIITEQTNLTANTVASNDTVLLYDLSATALREATASDLLNSGIAITTSSVTAGANSDIVLTTNDGVLVNTGVTYTSYDGLTVVVSSTVHGLIVGQVVTISSAGTGYNGTFKITAVATNTFTYVMTTAATPVTGASCAYTRQGTVRVSEHETIAGNLYVDGNAVITGTTVQTGTLNVTGAIQKNGNVVSNQFVSYIQTRDIATYSINWGGNQNISNLNGTEITQLTYTVTPKKSGNLLILDYAIFCETAENTVFNVTRNDTILANSADASNNTWSGIAVSSYDANNDSTPSVARVRIVDTNTLATSSIYKVTIRRSENATSTFYLNRGFSSAGGFIQETGLSSLIATEIYV